MLGLLRVLRDVYFGGRPDDRLRFVCVEVREEEERDFDYDQDDGADALIVAASDHIVDRQEQDGYNS